MTNAVGMPISMFLGTQPKPRPVQIAIASAAATDGPIYDEVYVLLDNGQIYRQGTDTWLEVTGPWNETEEKQS